MMPLLHQVPARAPRQQWVGSSSMDRSTEAWNQYNITPALNLAGRQASENSNGEGHLNLSDQEGGKDDNPARPHARPPGKSDVGVMWECNGRWGHRRHGKEFKMPNLKGEEGNLSTDSIIPRSTNLDTSLVCFWFTSLFFILGRLTASNVMNQYC